MLLFTTFSKPHVRCLQQALLLRVGNSLKVSVFLQPCSDICIVATLHLRMIHELAPAAY